MGAYLTALAIGWADRSYSGRRYTCILDYPEAGTMGTMDYCGAFAIRDGYRGYQDAWLVQGLWKVGGSWRGFWLMEAT